MTDPMPLRCSECGAEVEASEIVRELLAAGARPLYSACGPCSEAAVARARRFIEAADALAECRDLFEGRASWI